MKKIFLGVLGFLVVCSLGLYVFLFTPFGNSYVASIIETKANEKGIAAFKLQKFILTFNNINLRATIDKDSTVTMSGSYDVFSKSVNINYLIDIKDLAKLKKFTNQELIGSLALAGVVKGDEKKAVVVGKSNIFDSSTTYDVTLENFEPKSIDIKMEDAKIEQILSVSNQPAFAKGITDIVVKINDTKIDSLDGDVQLNINKATLNNKVLNKNFELNLTKVVNINGQINSQLIPNKVISKVDVKSNLANIFLKQNILNLKNKSIDSDYLITVNKLSDLSDFIKTSSTKGFKINGDVKGDEKLLDIIGNSNIFQSKSNYKINLKNKKPNKIDVNIKDAQLNELLAFSNQPIFANGTLDINAKIKDANIGTLDGVVDTNLKDIKLNNKVVNKNFDLKLKKRVTLNLKANSILKGDNIISALDLKSSILNLKAKTLDVNLKTNYIKTPFDIKIENLNNLYDLTGTKLNGSANLSGDINGDEKELKIAGKSDIFSSKLKFDVLLKEFKPSSLNTNIKNAKIQKLLYTLNQPSYATGLINIDANIKNADVKKLDGKVNIKILKGKLNNKTVNKTYDLKLKKEISFKGDISTSLKPNTLISESKLTTSLANIVANKTIINLEDSSVKSDYEVDIGDLNNLYDLTNTKLKGKLKLVGTIDKAKDLVVTGKSNFLSGTFDFNLKNDDLEAFTQNIETKEALDMLYYPIVFDSKLNSYSTYNIKTQKGILTANLLNGKILPNKYTQTILQLTKLDMTREAYDKAILKSNINKKLIYSTLDMNSKNTEIDVPKSKIDLNKRTISALVQTRLDNVEFDTNISGSLDKPKVRIQTEKLIKSTIKTKAVEELQRKIFKDIDPDTVKNLLDKLF